MRDLTLDVIREHNMIKRELFDKRIYELLHSLTVPNEDNGVNFTCLDRLDRIEEELKGSRFEFCHKENLFHAYAQMPFEELPRKIIVISSHVDFRNGTRDCFSDESNPDYLVGTYDNSITNAAIVALMKERILPPNVVVVFTGDEEEEQGGASQFSDYIHNELNLKAKCIVLDVTESGEEDGAVFTIENDCWKKKWGRNVLEWANNNEMLWKYVPYKKSRLEKKLIKELVSDENRIEMIADMDETSTYYEGNDIRCFSFCIPVQLMDPDGKYAPNGEGMHSAKGLKVLKVAYAYYIQALYEVIWVTSE